MRCTVFVTVLIACAGLLLVRAENFVFDIHALASAPDDHRLLSECCGIGGGVGCV